MQRSHRVFVLLWVFFLLVVCQFLLAGIKSSLRLVRHESGGN